MDKSMEVPQKMKNRTTIWPHSWPYIQRKQIQKDICTQMFAAALFTIAKTRKQSKYPSTNEQIKMMWYIYTKEYYLAIKKKEVMALAATWIDLDIVILSEVSQRKTNIIWYCLYVESKRKKRLKSTYFQNRDSHTENKIMATKGREGIH